MDKNSIIGFVLIACILIGFSWWSQPSAEEQRAAAQKDSIAQVEKKKEQAAQLLATKAKQKITKESVVADSNALFNKALTGTAQDIILKNNCLELTLNTKGAVVTKAYIRNKKGAKRYIGHDIADNSGNTMI